MGDLQRVGSSLQRDWVPDHVNTRAVVNVIKGELALFT